MKCLSFSSVVHDASCKIHATCHFILTRTEVVRCVAASTGGGVRVGAGSRSDALGGRPQTRCGDAEPHGDRTGSLPRSAKR